MDKMWSLRGHQEYEKESMLREQVALLVENLMRILDEDLVE